MRLGGGASTPRAEAGAEDGAHGLLPGASPTLGVAGAARGPLRADSRGALLDVRSVDLDPCVGPPPSRVGMAAPAPRGPPRGAPGTHHRWPSRGAEPGPREPGRSRAASLETRERPEVLSPPV